MACTVEVIDAHKKYEEKCPILRGLCMKVPRNTIYGLLGPSGCGKTTLLLAILGYNQLDSGEVVLKGPKRKRDFGYMPQEISLYGDFTTEEICTYFGAVYGLDAATCAIEARNLMNLFELPMDSTRLIKNLSGGQQRRLSLIVTLLHKPQLLVLDEPTVGLDCMLTLKIWDHLVGLTKQETTVIITTHYIQEAARCNTVGMMREGRLLNEGAPTTIMESLNVQNLEEAFLKLCAIQTDHKEPPVEPPPTKRKNTSVFKDESRFNRTRYTASLFKQYCYLKRNKLQLLETLFYCLMTSFCYQLAIRDPSNIPIGFISEELGANNCSHPTLTYYPTLNCSLPPVTCSLKKHLASQSPVINYYDDMKATRDLYKGIIYGYVYLNENYTSNFVQRILLTGNVLTRTEDFDVALGDSVVTIDTSDYVLMRFTYKHLMRSHQAMYDELLSACQISPQLTRPPVSFSPVYGDADQTFRASSVSGMLIGISFYLPLLYTAANVLWEKTQGLFKRNTLAGVTYLEIVLAHLTWQYLFHLIQDVLSYFILLRVFPLPALQPGRDLQLFLLLLMNNTVGIAIGYMLVELFNFELAVMYSVCFLVVYNLTLSGSIWPIEGAWWLVKPLADLGPGTSLHRSIPSTLFRGFGLNHYDVYFGACVCIFWIAACGIGTTVLYTYRKKNL